jgi:hypothetical protein
VTRPHTSAAGGGGSELQSKWEVGSTAAVCSCFITSTCSSLTKTTSTSTCAHASRDPPSLSRDPPSLPTSRLT